MYVEHLVSLADAPERRSTNYIGQGNAKFAPRWGYAMDVSQFHNNVHLVKDV